MFRFMHKKPESKSINVSINVDPKKLLKDAIQANSKLEITQILGAYTFDKNHLNQANLVSGLYTIFQYSIVMCSPEIIQLLINHGGDVNLPDSNGDTPLHLAIRQFDLNKVNLLLENNANLESKGASDLNAYDYAVYLYGEDSVIATNIHFDKFKFKIQN